MTTTADVTSDIAAVEAATADLLATAAGLDDAALREDSLCTGWTRGHVLAHVSRNADAIARLVGWAVPGEPAEMYPGGQAARDADIESGSGRGADEQRDDLTRSARALADRLPALAAGTAVSHVEMRGGAMLPSERLPWMRLREVVFHHVDLRAGYAFSDVDPELLRRFLEDAVRRLADSGLDVEVRTHEGDAWTLGSGAVTVTGSRAGALLWLARQRPDGVSADGALPVVPAQG
jgi:maleylpyruvate isomerase